MPRVQVLYTHPTPKAPHLYSREHSPRHAEKKMLRTFGAFRVFRAVYSVGWGEEDGKQEENVECRKSLSKNTRSEEKKKLGGGESGDCLTRSPARNVKCRNSISPTPPKDAFPRKFNVKWGNLWSCVMAKRAFRSLSLFVLWLRVLLSTCTDCETWN